MATDRQESLHNQIVKGFGNHDISPAVMAYKLMRESTYVNESVLQYMINYIIIMADSQLVPFHLAELQQICRYLKISLEELGLTGTIGREPVDRNEFLAV
jgi:hypothetical protein